MDEYEANEILYLLTVHTAEIFKIF